MNLPGVEQVFSAIGSKVEHRRSKWLEGKCPFAIWRHESGKDNNPSFGIRWDTTQKSIVKCFSCGFGGDLSELHYQLAIEMRKDPSANIHLSNLLQLIADEFTEQEFDSDIPDFGSKQPNQEIKPYPESWLDSFKLIREFPEAVKYCAGRGITYHMQKKLDLRFDPVQRRVCFPFRDFKGRLMGVQGRAIDKDNKLRYYFYGYGQHKNMLVWLGEHHINLDKPVIICEGPTDYASIRRVYDNVCASFSAGVSTEKLKRLADAVEIITFYDFGKGGEQARAKIRKVLIGIPITDLIPPDAETDPGAMSLEIVSEYLEDHVNLLS